MNRYHNHDREKCVEPNYCQKCGINTLNYNDIILTKELVNANAFCMLDLKHPHTVRVRLLL